MKLKLPGQTPAPAAVAAVKIQDRRRRYAEKIRSADHAVDVPEPQNPKRRAKALKDPETFLRTYFRHEFKHEFDKNMKETIRLGRMVLESGGRFACVLPRGAGKTTVLARLALWALLAGLREFLVVLAATEPAAARILQMLAVDLMSNATLAADFPEVCEVFRAGEQKPQKIRALHAGGQLLHANATRDRLVFPLIPRDGSAAQGQVVVCRGLTGALRGITHTRPDGVTVRPSCVLVDDPQTDGSAASQQQTAERENLLAGAVLGLAGPKQTVAALVALTVIRPGDLADRLLDDKAHPEYQGRRFPLVERWPDAKELWAEYTATWQSQGPKAATLFYKAHREEMDAGADVSCGWRIRSGEVSAIQTAHNLRLEMGEAAFEAEMQGQPPTATAGTYTLTTTQILEHATDLPRLHLPSGATVFTGFIDINRIGAHWCLTAFDQKMTAHVVAYGRHPPHGELWKENAPQREKDLAIFGGLKTLCDQIAGTTFMQNGAKTTPSMVLVDCGYESEIVHRFVDTAGRYPFRLLAAVGKAAHKYRVNASTLIGRAHENAHFQRTLDGHTKYVASNVDFWREVAQRAFLGNAGEPGGCTLHAVENPKAHLPFAEHVVAEKLTAKYETDNGPRWEWHPVPGSHWDWCDALVGTYTAAALSGLSSTGQAKPKKKVAVYVGGRWITNKTAEPEAQAEQAPADAAPDAGEPVAAGKPRHRAVIGRPSGRYPSPFRGGW